jgi:uncharacterized RDD family membrane protein YckC
MTAAADTPVENPDRYVIASATGVDVSVTIAGTGSRSYAFLIDWHIRLLLALAWFVCAALIIRGQVFPAPTDKTSVAVALIAIFPALVIYFLYHPILEIAMRGRTPGKRIAGVRLISRSGGAPSAGALLIRNVFRLIDAMPAFYMVGLTSTLVSARHVRIGDLAAGTLLVFDQEHHVQSLEQLGDLAQNSKLDPSAVDLLNDLLARWAGLDEKSRTALARALLERLDKQATPSELNALSQDALRSRLLTLLRPETPEP